MEFDCGRPTIKLACNSKSSTAIGSGKLKKATDWNRKIHRGIAANI